MSELGTAVIVCPRCELGYEVPVLVRGVSADGEVTIHVDPEVVAAHTAECPGRGDSGDG